MKRLHLMLLICGLTLGLCIVSLYTHFIGNITEISDFCAESEDGYIFISWNASWGNIWDLRDSKIVLSIKNEDNTWVNELGPLTSQYCFKQGEHGKLYTIEIWISNGTEVLSDKLTQNRLFLVKDSLPDLPLIEIVTDNYKEPTCCLIDTPEYCMGESIADNDYISGKLSFLENEKVKYAGTIKIRVRGNSTARGEKKPYKLVLSDPYDLLERNIPECAQTDWLLLDCKNLNFSVGTFVANLCGLEWQPEYCFVNVILNGDWKGSYMLVESPERGSEKINVSDTGFIIEDDAYWWKEEIYFKTDRQPGDIGYGYTFSYPSPENLTENRIRQVRNYINTCENLIFNGDPVYSDYIDIDTFTSWLLTHDLLGTSDMGGSNIIFYKYDLNENDPCSSKLKVGPAWDFDSIFMTPDEWSNIHKIDYSGQFFNRLVTFSDFKNLYSEKWFGMKKTLMHCVNEYLNTLDEKYSEQLQSSWDLDAERWKFNTDEETWKTFLNQISAIEEWFTERIDWMNTKIPFSDEAQ